MDETEEYFTDNLKLAPSYSECYIQSLHVEILRVINRTNPEMKGVYQVINLTSENQEKLLQATLDKHIEEFIHSMEIKFDDKLFFEGYDGLEYGTITNTVKLPAWFAGKYIETEMCNISTEW